MKTSILTITLILLFSCVYAQDIQYKSTRTSKYDPTLAEGLHKISFFPLGYAYEKRIAEEFTLEAGIDFSFDVDFADDLESYSYVINPTIHLEPRYYYNLQKRYERGRNVNFNSASYIGIFAELTMNSLIEENHNHYPVYDRFKIGPAWGMQRNIGRRGYWNLNFAYGLIIDQEKHINYELFSRFTIGIRLNGVVEK